MTTDVDQRITVDLSGQVAFVTGGGRGLGRAFPLGLAKAGAKIAVTARTDTAVAETVVRDDEEALVRRTDEIRQDNLHVLTVRT